MISAHRGQVHNRRSLLPGSLQGQVLLALAAALLLAQAISGVLLYRAQIARREEALVHSVALRLLSAGHRPDEMPGQARGVDLAPSFALIPQDRRQRDVEAQLRQLFADQGSSLAAVTVVMRPFADDPVAQAHLAQREMLFAHHPPPPRHVLIAAIQLAPQGTWHVVRMIDPPDQGLLIPLLVQTMVIYTALVGAAALILRRMTRPLAALTRRLEYFAETRDPQGRLEPSGPDDLRHLIGAHNALETRVISLLDEKDVMLGAIGHDLKTPLTALRVRIESVEDDVERGRMAATIEDIVRSLDDILSLARVGRSSDPVEPTELSALALSIVEEFEDMGQPVTASDMPRLVVLLRATWIRRALRNLIDNALRYGHAAHVSLMRGAGSDGRERAVIHVDDTGPGIAEDEIGHMLEAFTRGDPSRCSETGGAGLGLTLALAIAQQHGGRLELVNLYAADGTRAGLSARLSLPI